MLLSLAISNFILIEKLAIDFKSGLTVFTGETGAGKSILLDALKIACGQRANTKLLKDKSKSLSITAVFNIRSSALLKEYLLAKHLIEETTAHEIIMRRIITSEGKSKSYINDTQVNSSTLTIISSHLIEICGQHDNTGLLNSGNYISYLDTYLFLGSKLSSIKYIFSQLKGASETLDKLRLKKAESEFEISFLEKSLKEIEDLSYQHDEIETLVLKKEMLTESVKAKESLHKITDIFHENVILKNLYSIQKEAAKFPLLFTNINKTLDSAILDIEDVNSQFISLEKSTPSTDTYQLIEDRIFKIKSFCKKNNIGPEEIFSIHESKKLEILSFKSLDEDIQLAYVAYKKLKTNYLNLANEISLNRHEGAKELSSKINIELSSLKMANAEFKIIITSCDKKENWSLNGIDKVMFTIRTNLNSEFDSIGKIASGGELSRLMLALKIVISNSTTLSSIIFDEIDSGISGAVADAVGKKLHMLANNYQIFAITHQPQVAAYANNHILVEKENEITSTNTYVRELNLEERQYEVARMLSGHNITLESIAASKKLICSAHTL